MKKAVVDGAGDHDGPQTGRPLGAAEHSGSATVARPSTNDDTAPAFESPSHHRRIRSFVTRAGRTSPAQQRARETLGGRFVLPFAEQPIDFRATFGRTAPVVLEIGFGMGAATALIAEAHRGLDFLGVEVHAPGVGALLKLVGEHDLANLRIVEHDAVEVVERMIAPASLTGAHVYFPDPWHKARHNKRRLIQPAFVARLATRIAPGGFIHCATDWQDYAVQMLDVLAAEPTLINVSPDGYATRTNPLITRPITKFETRGQRLGHGVWDLVFVKRASGHVDVDP